MMKQMFKSLTLIKLTVLCSCAQKAVQKGTIEELMNNTEVYVGKYIQTEGSVRHVCGVDLRKLKLRSDSGLIIGNT